MIHEVSATGCGNADYCYENDPLLLNTNTVSHFNEGSETKRVMFIQALLRNESLQKGTWEVTGELMETEGIVVVEITW